MTVVLARGRVGVVACVLWVLALVAIVAWPAACDGIASVAVSRTNHEVQSVATHLASASGDPASPSAQDGAAAATSGGDSSRSELAALAPARGLQLHNAFRLGTALTLVALLLAWPAHRRFARRLRPVLIPPGLRGRAPDPSRGPPLQPSMRAPRRPARCIDQALLGRCMEEPNARPCPRGENPRRTCTRVDRVARHRRSTLA